VYITITSDLPCSEIKGVAVTVGDVKTAETNNPASTSDPKKCEDAKVGRGSTLGSVVITPGSEPGFTVRVVAGIDIQPDQCGVKDEDDDDKDDDYTGCIVARRSLNFVSKSNLKLPIFLSGSCEGVGCTARPNETCVLGACVPAVVTNPEICEDEGVCGEGVLTDETKPPPEPAPVECGRPSVIRDNFNDNMGVTQWAATSTVGGVPAQMGQALVLAPAPKVSDPSVVEYRSERTVNLLRDAITVRVLGMVNTSSEARAYLAAEYDETRSLRIEQKSGKLRFLGPDAMEEIPYDPKAHAFWEIRATTDKIHMRTSPNGVEWAIRATFPRPAFADLVQIVLGAGTDTPVDDPGKVTFDNVNQGRPPALWCKADKFSEVFNDKQDLSAWVVEKEGFEQETPDCNVVENGMNLVFTSGGATTFSTCVYRGKTAFDLRDSSVVLQLDSAEGIDDQVQFYLSLSDDDNQGMDLGIMSQGDVLKFFHTLRGLSGVALAVPHDYDSEVKFFRIREANKIVYLETAKADMKFDPIFKAEKELEGIAIDALHVSLVLATTNPQSPPKGTTVKVVAVNPPPPPMMP
jgi:hypothetical protein